MTETLLYPGMQLVLHHAAVPVVTVPTDRSSGVAVEAAEAILERGPRPAFIYIMCDGHNPLGISLSLQKRIRLVELAHRYDVPIVEDDAYGFLSYDQPVPPLRSLDSERVFYVGSFSKTVAPALRVGWIVAPKERAIELSNAREAATLDTAGLSQLLLSEYIEAGRYATHLSRLRSVYRERRDAMLDTLARTFPADAYWIAPSSGMFVWVEWPDGPDTTLLLKHALSRVRVAFMPGSCFEMDCNGAGRSGMRLNFANHAVQQIDEGITQLGQVMHSFASDHA
jgi:2-aminoadipate transaminase